MSLPIFILNQQVYNAQSMSADITSSGIEVAGLGGFAVHFIWTGTPTGSVSVEASNDNSNFVQIDTQAFVTTDGQHLLNVERPHYKYIRLKYTRTTGTGALTAYVSGKQI
jgi:hypothetical protein